MASKLVPSNPAEVMVTRSISPNITTFSTPFWRFGHIKIGGRGTIVRLRSGALAVFSPVALTPEVQEKVKSLGDIKYITALDAEHHIFLGPWHQAYPDAKVIGPEGLPEKRKKQKNEDVPFSVVFKKGQEVTIDPEFDSEFDYEFVHSHPNKELVFNYKPEKTLIEADLMFNLPATEQFSRTGTSPTAGILTKIFNYINNTKGTALAQKRFLWYAISSSDRPGFNASVQKIDKWDFEKIIPCHGDVIETGGHGIFQKVFAWHLEGKKST